MQAGLRCGFTRPSMQWHGISGRHGATALLTGCADCDETWSSRLPMQNSTQQVAWRVGWAAHARDGIGRGLGAAAA